MICFICDRLIDSEYEKKQFVYQAKKQSAHKQCFRDFWYFIKEARFDNDEVALIHFKEKLK